MANSSGKGDKTYKTLEALGPEHEFSIVDSELKVLPIVDKIMKGLHGRIVNSVERQLYTFGKELQMHVMEIKPNRPFRSPIDFEETIQEAVLTMCDLLQRKHSASLLGTGMHPMMRLEETVIWPHRHRQIYESYGRVFNLRRHGWLNVQSFQLNLPYSDEKSGVLLHNILANICPYLPALSASSPIYEGSLSETADNRLKFYAENQKEVPSVTGDVVPEYVFSFDQYRKEIIEKYSSDMLRAGADRTILGKDWVNSRGAIFRFDRKAIEIRVMDEQECIKSDVALSCFVRALLRGLTKEGLTFLPHAVLVKDFKLIMEEGLNSRVQGPYGQSARQVCQHFLRVARANATEEEKKYLGLVQKRIEKGNLSETIRERLHNRAQKTDLKDAIIGVYSQLIESLIDNQPYF